MNNVVNNQYVVKFNHSQTATKELYRGRTICQIFPINDCKKDSLPIVSGAAFCSIKDRFIKAQGLKYALRNALSKSNFDKQTRQMFWEWLKEYSPKVTNK